MRGLPSDFKSIVLYLEFFAYLHHTFCITMVHESDLSLIHNY